MPLLPSNDNDREGLNVPTPTENDESRKINFADRARTVIMGAVQDNGTIVQTHADEQGHLEFAIHSPRLPYGAVWAETTDFVFQLEGTYGLNSKQLLSTPSNGGSVTVQDGMFYLSSGTNAAGQAVLQSKSHVRHRPGQGLVWRFNARWDEPRQNQYSLVGAGHAEDGIFIGYKNLQALGDPATPEFGVLHSRGGVRRIQTLTVTVGATSGANCTITLNGVAHTVALTAASNIQRTVYEIASASYTGFRAYPLGATVVFVANSAGVLGGSYSFSAGTTGASASFTGDPTRAGKASTDDWYPQSVWVGDPVDGDGPSGFYLNPQDLNQYQMNVRGGSGAFTFGVEASPPDNNPTFITFHRISNDRRKNAAFRNPSMPGTIAVYNAGNTQDTGLWVSDISCASEGLFKQTFAGVRTSVSRTLASTVTTTNKYAFFSLLNPLVYKGEANQVVVRAISMTVAAFDSGGNARPATVFLIRNGTLVGNPSFSKYASNDNSVLLIDQAATQVTVATNDQIIFVQGVGTNGELNYIFEDIVALRPGDMITVCATASSGTFDFLTVGLNLKEDL